MVTPMYSAWSAMARKSSGTLRRTGWPMYRISWPSE